MKELALKGPINAMKNFNLVAKFPEVLGAAVSDASGALVDCVGQMDGEVSGAVHAFTARALAQAGEVLGLSALERASIVAPTGTSLIAVHEDSVLGVNIDPRKPLNLVENKIWDCITK